MTTITLTPARAAVLKAVGDGKVTHHRSMRTSEPDHDEHELSPGRHRKVTRDMQFLAEAGLAHYRMESGRLDATWKLTTAGEQWLAENEGRA